MSGELLLLMRYRNIPGSFSRILRVLSNSFAISQENLHWYADMIMISQLNIYLNLYSK